MFEGVLRRGSGCMDGGVEVSCCSLRCYDEICGGR